MVRWLIFSSGLFLGGAISLGIGFNNLSNYITPSDFGIFLGLGLLGGIFGILSMIVKD